MDKQSWRYAGGSGAFFLLSLGGSGFWNQVHPLENQMLTRITEQGLEINSQTPKRPIFVKLPSQVRPFRLRFLEMHRRRHDSEATLLLLLRCLLIEKAHR